MRLPPVRPPSRREAAMLASKDTLGARSNQLPAAHLRSSRRCLWVIPVVRPPRFFFEWFGTASYAGLQVLPWSALGTFPAPVPSVSSEVVGSKGQAASSTVTRTFSELALPYLLSLSLLPFASPAGTCPSFCCRASNVSFSRPPRPSAPRPDFLPLFLKKSRAGVSVE